MLPDIDPTFWGLDKRIEALSSEVNRLRRQLELISKHQQFGPFCRACSGRVSAEIFPAERCNCGEVNAG